MSSKETQSSIDLTSETKEFFELLSEEIYEIYKQSILIDEYMRGMEDVTKSEDVTEQDDYKDFVKTNLESAN
jgi:hypothetical protein